MQVGYSESSKWAARNWHAPARERDVCVRRAPRATRRTLGAMKQLHSPDRRGEDSGDPDRRIPDALADEGGLDTGLEPDARLAPDRDDPMHPDHDTDPAPDEEGGPR